MFVAQLSFGTQRITAQADIPAGDLCAGECQSALRLSIETIHSINITGQFHTTALRGIHQTDFTGAHAAQIIAVQRNRVFPGGNSLHISGNGIVPGDHIQCRRADLPVGINRRRNQIQHFTGRDPVISDRQ